MKLTMKLLVLFFGVLLLASAAHAESPREQLKQMVEQLQKTPTDNALRENIIKLAQELKPAPAVPEEAIRFEGRAQQMFKVAKSNQDYRNSVREYLKALNLAPWVGGYYSDLCIILEKLGHYTQARGACLLYLKAEPTTEDVTDVKRKLAGFEIPIENSKKKPSYEAAKLMASLGMLREARGYVGTLDSKEVTLAITTVSLDAGKGATANQLKVSVQIDRGESSWFVDISDARKTISVPGVLTAVLSISTRGDGIIELTSTKSSDSIKTTLADLFEKRKTSIEEGPVISWAHIDKKDSDIVWGKFTTALAVTGYDKGKTATERKIAFFTSNCNGELENGDPRQVPIELREWDFVNNTLQRVKPRIVLDCEAHSLGEAAWLEEIK